MGKPEPAGILLPHEMNTLVEGKRLKISSASHRFFSSRKSTDFSSRDFTINRAHFPADNSNAEGKNQKFQTFRNSEEYHR
jgi:hypothetical protein